MTVTFVGGSAVSRSGSTFTPIPAGGSVGDVLVLSVLLFKDASFTPGTDTITVPAGWASLGGVPEPGYARGVRRQWWKIAEAGDLSGTTTVTVGAAWGSFTTDQRASIDAFPGGVRIVGGPVASSKPAGSGTFVPTIPAPTVPALLVAYTLNGYSGGFGGLYLNGWGPDTAEGPMHLAYQSPPFVGPVYDPEVAYQGWNAFGVTDIPEARGWHIGSLRFGLPGPGF